MGTKDIDHYKGKWQNSANVFMAIHDWESDYT